MFECLCGAFDVELVGGVLDADKDAVGVVGEPPLGLFDLVGGEGEHLEAAGGVAVGDGHGDGNGQAYHAGAGDTHAHSVLVDILAEFEADARGLAAQGLDGFGHTEGHGAGFRTAGGQHHLLLHDRFQLLSYVFFHRFC